MAIVYGHRRKNNSEMFYIGIGKAENRAYDSNSRSIQWKRIAAKHKYIVEIIESDVSWSSAQELEKFLINKYGRLDIGTGTLVNKNSGGGGSTNLSEKV